VSRLISEEVQLSEGVLASWNDGAAKSAIQDFLLRATTLGPDFVPVADRIAAFDNDGTLWGGGAAAAAVRLRVSHVGGGGQG
jgi:hypothetical protein